MRYGSVCSGIEAATTAWHELGWEPAFFSEIEAFPRAVLAHHYPSVPLHGDFTTIGKNQYGAIDLLVGGTPCQSFSVAGLRGGLDDERGNLALEFCRLADRERPRWIVWENVPGVLSSNGGRDFGSILGALAQLGYGLAYRVLDAQYFGVPQRRRRVFVVGYLGDWRRAAAVLFERQSLLGRPAPRREAREDVAPTISSRPTGGGGLGTDFDCDGGLILSHDRAPTLRAKANDSCRADMQSYVARPCLAHGVRLDAESETFVAHSLRGRGFDASEDGTGRGTPIVAFQANAGRDFTADDDRSPPLRSAGIGDVSGVAVAFSCKDSGADAGEIAPTLRAMAHSGSHANAGGQVAIAIQERAVCENPDAGPGGVGVRDDGLAYTLEARTTPQAVAFPLDTQNMSAEHASGGLGFGQDGDPSLTLGVGHHHAVAFDMRRRGFDAREDGTGRGTPSIAIHSDAPRANSSAKTPSPDAEGRIRLRDPGIGIGAPNGPMFTLAATQPHAVAFDLRGREGGAQMEGPHDTANIRAASGGSSRSFVAESWAVRRLTPRECERLQGFPDDYTLVEYRKKPAADGPRYKALGNSMAVPVMRWIGTRIQLVDDLLDVL